MAKRVQYARKPPEHSVLNKALARRYQNSNNASNKVVKPNGSQPRKPIRRLPATGDVKRAVVDLIRDSTPSTSPSPDRETASTTSPVHDMPPITAPRRYIRKGETPSQEPRSQPGVQAQVDPDVARARHTLSPDSAIQYLDRLLNDDVFAEQVAQSLKDSDCCVRTELGVRYGHEGRPVHDLGPLVFRRALDKQKAQRQMRILPSAMKLHPTPPNSPCIAGSSKKPISAMSPTVRFASSPEIIPSNSSAYQTPTVLAENLRIFESLHPILRAAMFDEVCDVQIPTVPSVMMIRNPQALHGVIMLHIFQFPLLDNLRKVRPDWAKARGGPAPTKEDVEKALVFLDRIGAPRSLVRVYSSIHNIDISAWRRSSSDVGGSLGKSKR